MTGCATPWSPDSEAGHPNPLSFSDEADLRAYFGRPLPSAPGERSNFGAVAARMGSKCPPDSPQRPTRGTPWTELVECSAPHAAVNFDGEEVTVAYLDARWRFRRVSEVLSRLPLRNQEVLEAYYASDAAEHQLGELAAVACLTQAARHRNRSRAARGLHEPIEATVRWLSATTAPEARAAFEDVQRQAAGLLWRARHNYALVRRGG